MENRRNSWNRYRGGIFFPIVLIAIGVVILLKNTGALTGDIWDLFLQLWPILIIAMGLDSLVRRQGVVGPVFWIAVGAVFLLSNLGLIALNPWDLFLRMWPVIIIAIGLDILVGRRSLWGSIAALVILAAVVAGSLWYIGYGLPGASSVSSKQISQPLDGTQQAIIDLRPAVATLNIRALNPGSSSLIEGVVRYASNETINVSYPEGSQERTLSISSQGLNTRYSTGSEAEYSWDLQLTPSIPLDLRAEMAVGRGSLDLTGLNIRAVKTSLAVGSLTLILPENGSFSGKLDGAIGDITIVVPSGTAVSVRNSGALCPVSAPSDFQKIDNVYTSKGYDQAANKIDLEAGLAIGHITIRYK